jgi:hypothetical protein
MGTTNYFQSRPLDKSFPSVEDLMSVLDDGNTADSRWDEHPLGKGLHFDSESALQSPMGSATNMAQKTNSATDGLKQAHEEVMNLMNLLGGKKGKDDNINHLADMHRALQEFGREGLSLPGSSDVKVKYDAHGRPFTTVDMGAHGGPDDRSSPNETMYFGSSEDWKNNNNARPSTLAAPWVNKGAKKGFDYNTKDHAFGSYA